MAVVLLLIGACTSESSTLVQRDDWQRHFDEAGLAGTFVVSDLETGKTQVVGFERAETRLLPASTFKILNSLVILETGALDDVDELVPWSGEDHGVTEWNRDHSLRTGIEVSAVWMYQRMARQVGEEAMADWVAAAGYGNADIGGNIDSFWLDGDLRISAIEQVEFLSRLVSNDLPFATGSTEAVREILVRESGPDWSFAHKTGTSLRTTPNVGWLVGFAEHRGDTWVFALNFDLDTQADVGSQIDPQPRIRLAKSILRSIGALPPA